jgi:mono/diheme cytochrome c family protein
MLAIVVSGTGGSGLAEEDPGLVIYRTHCQRCHGEHGAGTAAVPDPLVGDRSVNQLAASIHETMPEDDPSLVTGDAARQVAAFIHSSFYSAVARDRSRPARVELSRLTVRQYRQAVADIVATFRAADAEITADRGLKGEYFKTREFSRRKGFVLERLDPRIDFDFGKSTPAAEIVEPFQFAIRWTGSILPTETGMHEFVIQTEHAAKLAVNAGWNDPPLIDATVKSGTGTETRASIFLLGGRAYPLRLEFSKSDLGDDGKPREPVTTASIRLLWRPPHGAVETVPERVLIPHDTPPVFVLKTPFPPDDKSIGYERGSAVSPEWFEATTAAAIETAAGVLEHVDALANTKRDAVDRSDKLRRFAAAFAEQAFRRPLDAPLRSLVVDRPFADAPDPDTALRRSLLLVLGSPRFLFREAAAADPFSTAARISFGLWDSIPDQSLWQAAVRGDLATPAQVRDQALRMVSDRRTRAKVRDFLFSWLRLDLGPELAKDTSRHPDFSPEVAADLRTSLELFLDETVWGGGDFRRLFTDDEVHLNGRLSAMYGGELDADAPFTRVRLDDGRRGGILSHPYLMSALSYPAATSPIHRGVFLARSVLGNVLKPPQEAVAPLPAAAHPDLSTRERVALQTSAVACQTCHTLINPLGFALEEFDEVGRYRTIDISGGGAKPIDATGSYLPREGPEATFRGARELAACVATSRDAQEAFVRSLFHAVAKQPVRAWGAETLERLHQAFIASGFDIRRLLVDIMEVVAFPPPVEVARVSPPEPSS